ncbi:intein N-terminal splicing region [Butyrivibrio sp. Su6]|uniref:Hint domain-containing protein n=1 Tax=Butyrivibrio sp. Su6 TaxID=1520810 RepID=UPI00089EB6D8|nr:Hint domain-containing protein [Butyrivibrio sp. Su6]SEF50727.1 intein N-terminal splicing region [Butyrivibrio sp. Su6]
MNRNFDCVDGNMDVLMYNNTLKKVRDLNNSDEIYAISYDGEELRYIKAKILGVYKRKSSAVKITLSDNRNIICSPCHQWLTRAGWHFSYDNGSIHENAFYIKNDMKMVGFSKRLTGVYEESRLYMAGYIISAEIYGRNLIAFHSGEYADFALRNGEVLNRVYNFLLYFGIDVALEDYFAHDSDTNEYFVTKKLRVSYKDMIRFSEKYSKYKDEPEFLRGFVAGSYDSDGSINPITKNVGSSKKEFLNIVKNGLELFDFEYSYNSEYMKAAIMGGVTELIRFYNIFKPVNKFAVENLPVRSRGVGNIAIVNIEKTKDDDLYEIITSSRSFIVNGIVSHDCTNFICGEVGR